MALRATRAKAPVAAETLARSKSARTPATAPVPVDLVPIVSRYKKQGRVSIRLERMPQSARLSHGRNNGSGSWSLAQDELEDLAYLPPENAPDEQVLAIRIIGQDGATLAMHELTVSASGQSLAETVSHKSAHAPADREQTRHLHNELDALKAKLAVREADLAETVSRAAHDLAEKQREWQAALPDLPGTLAEAETNWKAAEAARLAALEATWEKKFAAALADAEGERSRVQSDLSARDAADADARTARERDRVKWQREYDVALTQSKAQWESAEAARLASAESEWRRKSAMTHAELSAKCANLQTDLERVRAERLVKPQDNTQQRLLDELAATKAAFAASEAALADTRADVAAERTRQERDTQARFDDAKEKWRVAESTRLAAAQEKWEREATEKFAELTVRCDEAEDALAKARCAAPVQPPRDDEETERLRKDHTNLQVMLATREIELERLRLVTQAGAPFAPPQKITLHSDGGWHPSDPELPVRKLPLRFIAQLVVVILIAALATWAFPYAVSLLPYDWQYSIDETLAEFGLYGNALAPAAAAAPPQFHRAVHPQLATPRVTLTRPARLRVAPVKSAASLAVLHRGESVAVLETRDGWTRVRMDDKREGWIFSTSLPDDASAAKKK